jgi:formate hydrogenlyase transcriptional activator
VEDSALKYRTLTEISEAFLGCRDCEGLFRSLWDSLSTLIRFDFLLLILIDEKTRRARIEAMAGDIPASRLAGQDMPLDGSPSAVVWETQEPLYIPDHETREHVFRPDLMEEIRRYGVRGGLWVPLTTVRGRLGSMVFSSRQVDPYTPDDREFMQHIARHVAIAVENALAFEELEGFRRRVEDEKIYLEEEIRSEHRFNEIVGHSNALRHVLEQIRTAAPTDSTVLIQGETGTGKELVARAIHEFSRRSSGTFVKVNCSAIPAGLLESELFGHEKGAFTGAVAQRLGRFELANNGTLFLDEIGDLPLELQPKLLRVLQDGQFERLGGSRTLGSNTRLVAATNRDLRTLVAEQEFRTDLFYRLNVFPITIPPLRERREDIPVLVRYFVQDFSTKMRKPIQTISAEAMDALVSYSWPGNVRELRNVIERSVILTTGERLFIPRDALADPQPGNSASLLRMADAEKRHILDALKASKWIVGGPRGAAAILGLKRSTLQSRMQKLGIRRNIGD